MSALKQKTIVRKGDFMSISDLYYLCLAKWKWFVASLIIALGIASIYIIRTTPVYSRSASILMKDISDGNSISSEIERLGILEPISTVVNDEILVFKSPALMYEVVKRLNLDMNYYIPGTFYDIVAYGKNLPVTVSIHGLEEKESVGFNLHILKDGNILLNELTKNGVSLGDELELKGVLSDTIESQLGKIVITPTAYYDVDEDYTLSVIRTGMYDAVGAYSSKLDVSLGNEDTSVILVSVKDYSIQRADDVINTLIEVYNENWVKDKNQIAVYASKFIDERISVIEEELGNVDENISSYKSDNLLPDVLSASNMYMEQNNQGEAKILELNNQRYMATYIRKSLGDEKNKNQLLPINSGIENSNIEKHIEEYNTKLLQRNNLVANSSEDNPLVLDMDLALNNMRQAIIISIDNQIITLNNQINNLQKSMRQTTARIAANPGQAKYLLSVERQQKIKESLYLFLLQKREENQLSQAFTAYNNRVIAPPYGSSTPVSPMRNDILLVAFALGLFIPMFIIIIKENMNTKVLGRKHLKNISLPFLGEIPQIGMHNGGLFFFKKKSSDKFIVVKEGLRDVVNESFRVLRTNFEFITKKERKANVSIVTSFIPNSGKSFLTMNIAACLTLKKNKVLVIDGDLRRATLSSNVKSPNIGLSDYLNGQVDNLNNIIVSINEYKNLYVLPVGTIPPNPTELLVDDRLQQIIDIVRNNYDYIFIDCPPIELVADSQILEQVADRTIFVIRAGMCEQSMLDELEDIYANKKYKNIAIVLNGTDPNSRYSHNYNYEYQYASEKS